jgi:hypothetical protein
MSRNHSIRGTLVGQPFGYLEVMWFAGMNANRERM